MAASSGVISAIRRLPVVVILGATGTGKSKLAIEIGRRLNGEIISADAMQLYQGLDVVTNKVTQEEQDQCPHHMIGYVNPHSFYTVTDFRNKAIPLIDGLLQRGQLPVIVGGTNYYIEALLWNILMGEEKETNTLTWEEKPLKRFRIKRRHRTPQKSRYYNDVDSSMTRQLNSVHIDNAMNRTHHEGDLRDKSSGSERLSLGDQDVLGDERKDGAMVLKRDVKKQVECDRKRCNEHKGELEEHAQDHERSQKQQSSSDSQRRLQPESTTSQQVESSNIGTISSSQTGCHGGGGACDTEEQVQYYDEIDVDETDSATLHRILADVDPQRAYTLHPNDRRKIIRSLQVYNQQGIPHSTLMDLQHRQEGASSISGPLRYSNLCILWLQSDMKVLRERLDARVDDMMERGLVEELAEFHRQHNQQRLESQNTKTEEQYVNGIFQSIGFKEFHDYLILSEEDKATDEGARLLADGLEKMKIATRQYARKQNKWVRNRFIKRPGPTAPSVYSLDVTDPARWEEAVSQPALNILEHLIQGKNPPVEPVYIDQPITEEKETVSQNATFICDVCNEKLIVGVPQWQAHLKSRAHAKRKRKAAMRNWEQQQSASETEGKTSDTHTTAQ